MLPESSSFAAPTTSDLGFEPPPFPPGFADRHLLGVIASGHLMRSYYGVMARDPEATDAMLAWLVAWGSVGRDAVVAAARPLGPLTVAALLVHPATEVTGPALARNPLLDRATADLLWTRVRGNPSAWMTYRALVVNRAVPLAQLAVWMAEWFEPSWAGELLPLLLRRPRKEWASVPHDAAARVAERFLTHPDGTVRDRAVTDLVPRLPGNARGRTSGTPRSTR